MQSRLYPVLVTYACCLVELIGGRRQIATPRGRRAGLLYAGTEFGIYVSFDNGRNWQSFQQSLPVTPVTDIRVAHEDLVVSTQGRSFWILDDLTPLHQLNEKSASAGAILFQPRDGIRTPGRAALEGLGPGRTSLKYPRSGAMIDYYLAAEPQGEIAMEILDGAGKVVRTLAKSSGYPKRRR